MRRTESPKVGQMWHHRRSGDECELTSIEEIPDAPLATRVVLLDQVTNKLRPMLETTLTTAWKLVSQPGPRRIRLSLAADTTATECGACSMLDEYEYGGSGCCHAFEDKSPPNPGGIRQRLPECIAAEVSP